MNGKQKKTLQTIFAEPVSATIEWRAIENLLVAVGCRVSEGAGSRVRFECRGVLIAGARARRPSLTRSGPPANF